MWIVGAIVMIVFGILAAPMIARAALVVLVTGIVALAKGTPTWLRFRSRRAAVVAISIAAVGFMIFGTITSATLEAQREEVAPVVTAEPVPLVAVDAVLAEPASSTVSEWQGGDDPPIDSGAAVEVLATLEIRGRAPKTGYSRDAFGPAWADVDQNGCDTRNDILRRDLTGIATDDGCTIASGVLFDPYTAGAIDFERSAETSSTVQIDLVVAALLVGMHAASVREYGTAVMDADGTAAVVVGVAALAAGLVVFARADARLHGVDDEPVAPAGAVERRLESVGAVDHDPASGRSAAGIPAPQATVPAVQPIGTRWLGDLGLWYAALAGLTLMSNPGLLLWGRVAVGLGLAVSVSAALIAVPALRGACAASRVPLIVGAHLVGASRRLAAPFLVGIVVVPIENAVAFLVQIGRGIQSMPWWITLAVVGAVLLIIAVTYERRAGEHAGIAARLRDLA